MADLGAWATGLTSLGRLTGLVSSLLLLVQVLLMACVPVLEHAFGQDRLARLHRLAGFTSFSLLLAHVGLVTWGYAAGRLLATPGTFWELATDEPGILLAVAGTACPVVVVVVVVVTSVRAARRRLRYESWHLLHLLHLYLHLYAYLGVGLALPRQLWTGQDFLASPAVTAPGGGCGVRRSPRCSSSGSGRRWCAAPGTGCGSARWSRRGTACCRCTSPAATWPGMARGEVALADCPPEVAEVLELGERARRDSAGAFAVRRRGPDGTEVLDPSGVVKGWAGGRAAVPLRSLPDTDFCLSLGGDLVCRTLDAGAPPWRIGIEDPADPRRLVAVGPVPTGAVATSGTAHRGRHLVDARTGAPPEGVASVTVVAASLIGADVDGTAAYALGADAVRWLAGRPGRTGLVVWADGTTTLVGAE